MTKSSVKTILIRVLLFPLLAILLNSCALVYKKSNNAVPIIFGDVNPEKNYNIQFNTLVDSLKGGPQNSLLIKDSILYIDHVRLLLKVSTKCLTNLTSFKCGKESFFYYQMHKDNSYYAKDTFLISLRNDTLGYDLIKIPKTKLTFLFGTKYENHSQIYRMIDFPNPTGIFTFEKYYGDWYYSNNPGAGLILIFYNKKTSEFRYHSMFFKHLNWPILQKFTDYNRKDSRAWDQVKVDKEGCSLWLQKLMDQGYERNMLLDPGYFHPFSKGGGFLSYDSLGGPGGALNEKVFVDSNGNKHNYYELIVARPIIRPHYIAKIDSCLNIVWNKRYDKNNTFRIMVLRNERYLTYENQEYYLKGKRYFGPHLCFRDSNYNLISKTLFTEEVINGLLPNIYNQYFHLQNYDEDIEGNIFISGTAQALNTTHSEVGGYEMSTVPTLIKISKNGKIEWVRFLSVQGLFEDRIHVNATNKGGCILNYESGILKLDSNGTMPSTKYDINIKKDTIINNKHVTFIGTLSQVMENVNIFLYRVPNKWIARKNHFYFDENYKYGAFSLSIGTDEAQKYVQSHTYFGEIKWYSSPPPINTLAIPFYAQNVAIEGLVPGYYKYVIKKTFDELELGANYLSASDVIKEGSFKIEKVKK
jgi:hypothetical protein